MIKIAGLEEFDILEEIEIAFGTPTVEEYIVVPLNEIIACKVEATAFAYLNEEPCTIVLTNNGKAFIFVHPADEE